MSCCSIAGDQLHRPESPLAAFADRTLLCFSPTPAALPHAQGYGAPAAAAYGQTGYGAQAAQKRPADQAYGTYGATGYGGGGVYQQGFKRGRF